MDSTFKYRGTVNKELAERYKWDVPWRGADKARNDAAAAKRTATQLTKTIRQFENTVRPEQKLAMEAAASVMRTLSTELDQVVAWARAYKIHCDRVAAVTKDEEEDVVALKRWAGDDAAMLAEFKDLIEFLDDGCKRPAEINEWVRNFKQLPAKVNVFVASPYDSCSKLRAMVLGPVKPSEVLKIRRKAAEVWQDVSERRGGRSRDGSDYIVGAADYEAWRATRKTAPLQPNFKTSTLAPGEAP